MGRYVLVVDVHLDVPLKASGYIPEHVKPLLQYSEIFNFNIRLESEILSTPSYNEVGHPIYEGYGQLGFFIADLDKMDDYMRLRLGHNRLNLKDALCETEIANELFGEGLLVLVWGMIPWQYYVYGLDSPKDIAVVPSLNNPQFQGSYKFRSDIKRPSVVPGEFLLNWPECLSLDLPKVALEGEGEQVAVQVHVIGFHVVGGALARISQ